MRIKLAECTEAELQQYCKDRQPYVERKELIFATGALDNRSILADLGSAEQARWWEGRRAADPERTNPYYREQHYLGAQ